MVVFRLIQLSALSILAILPLFTLLPGDAHASKMNGEFVRQTGQAKDLQNNTLSIQYDVSWELNTLLGEPLKLAKLKWYLPEGATINGSNISNLPSYRHNVPLKLIPPQILENIKLYDVNISIKYVQLGSGDSFWVDFDLGIPGKHGGEHSFNVYGSPKWDKLFKGHSNDLYFDAESTRSLMKKGEFRAAQIKINKAKVKLNDVLLWIQKNSDKKAINIKLTNARKHLDIIDSVLELPASKLARELDYFEDLLERADSFSAIAKLDKKVDMVIKKLESGVPARYQLPGIGNYYASKRRQLKEELEKGLKISVKAGKENHEELNYQNWKNLKTDQLKQRSADYNKAISKLHLTPTLDRASGKWGFKAQGQWVIEPRFLNAKEFDGTFAEVITDEKYKTEFYTSTNECGVFSRRSREVRYLKSEYIDRRGDIFGDPVWVKAPNPTLSAGGFKLSRKRHFSDPEDQKRWERKIREEKRRRCK
ncbi:MAG: hypothetical protein OIF51_16285 [Cellvibrionaceae bacterium]|nr:hypothetical protein [Cellvibrionaceae bacterium]